MHIMSYIDLQLKSDKVKNVVIGLNRLLANYHIYYQNLRNFHWNITGQNFFNLHEHFERLYDDAGERIDAIAERIATLRYKPESRVSKYLEMADVEEAFGSAGDREMVKKLLDDHRTLIGNMRQVIEEASEAGDEGTIDMMGGFLSTLEKNSWMLDAFLGDESHTGMTSSSLRREKTDA